jgi:hypothetical protein
MITDPLDPAAIMAEHQPNVAGDLEDAWCRYCADAWPCEPHRLAADLAAQRQTTAKIASLYLSLLIKQRLSDGTPVLKLVFDLDPRLADQFRAALAGEGAA